jgi:hypothetical protein
LDKLIYQDNPWYYNSSLPYWERHPAYLLRWWAWGWQISPIILTFFLLGLFIALPQVEKHYIVSLGILGITTFLVIAIGIALMPTKYQIFDDRIRIILGYIFHFDIPFSNIADIEVATFEDLWGVHLNFSNSFSSDDILEITRKHRAKVYITPFDRPLFLENLNKAIYDWKRSAAKVGS